MWSGNERAQCTAPDPIPDGGTHPRSETRVSQVDGTKNKVRIGTKQELEMPSSGQNDYHNILG